MMYYDNVEYARKRLSDTIVSLNNSPIYVVDISGDNLENALVHYNNLSSDGLKSCPLQNIDISPVKLGYVNTSSGSYYAVRKPARRWKQGLELKSLYYLGKPYKRGGWPLKELKNTIKGIYPSIDEALKLSVDGGESAWSREFCISNSDSLFYKGRMVGIVEKKMFKLVDKYIHLKEFLEESIEAKG